VADPGRGNPIEQNNWSSGTFVGGNNVGYIRNELLDPKTKAMLAKLSEDAPPLARLLSRALNDGIISPELADALTFAVRNINEEVADALRTAGRNINEEVATSLETAGNNIKKGAEKLEYLTGSLHNEIEQLRSQQAAINPGCQPGPAGAAAGTAGVAARSSRWGEWRTKLLFAGWGSGAGVVGAAILIYCHVGAWAWISGVLILFASAIIQSGKGQPETRNAMDEIE
jgi:hypothetical protein